MIIVFGRLFSNAKHTFFDRFFLPCEVLYPLKGVRYFDLTVGFTELDLCSSDPCSALYECKVGENTGYSCEAGVALYAVVVTSVMTSLGVASFVVFRLLQPSYKVVDHSW